MTDTETIRKLIVQGEGLCVEFKQSRDSLSRSVFETICAFLNRKGGYILLGVKDNATIEGVTEKSLPLQLKILACDMNNTQIIAPSTRIDTEVMDLDGRKIICIYVPESAQVHSYKGVYYDRQGEADIKLTTYMQISNLYIRKQAGYTENKIFPFMSMDDFVMEDIEKAKNEAILRNPNHPWKDMDYEEILRSSKMYLHDEKTGEKGFTMAAALMFGKEPVIYSVCPHYKIDVLCRKENMDRYDDRDLMTCNLYEAYYRLLTFIAKHTPDRFYLEGYFRLSIRELIFREMVANFLAHREYSNPYPARITIYKDTVVSENWTIPNVMGAITPDNVMPRAKNPAIDNFFRQLGWVEDLGSGIRNLYKYCPMYVPGSFPDMEENDVFQLTIRYEKEGDMSDTLDESLSNTKKVLMLIKENPKITAKQIAEIMSLSMRTIRNTLSELRQNSLIEREGSKKNGSWIIKE
ncbi:MAG: putative DNA binding domain-containing protein [Dysgonamonadaceae bacterium]|nr:putative DNA binding domain-containing protein [Dysgonamonadaceae bacterium]